MQSVLRLPSNAVLFCVWTGPLAICVDQAVLEPGVVPPCLPLLFALNSSQSHCDAHL